MSTNNEIQTADKDKTVVEYVGKHSHLLSTNQWLNTWRLAKGFADSTLIPKEYQGSVSNCFVALNTAIALDIDPVLFFQKTYVINNKITIEAQLAIAIANNSGVFYGPIRYTFSGKDDKDRSCTAYAVLRDSGETIENTVGMDTVRGFGWDTKTNSMWKKGSAMRDQMLRYRAAVWMIRAYVPEILAGLYIDEEIEGSVESERNRPPKLTTEQVMGLPENSSGDIDGNAEAAIDQIVDGSESVDSYLEKITEAVTGEAVLAIASAAFENGVLTEEQKERINDFATDRISMLGEE
jgi:hypothetical protein